ncbi:two-component system C4-dicarboxylate transport sensor histidine kinase DctB [Sinorhizobium fredii]
MSSITMMRLPSMRSTRPLILLATALLAIVGAMLFVRENVLDYGLRATATQAEERLKLIGATFSTRIERFRYLPEVIARSREIEDLFRNPASPEASLASNRLLTRINAASGALALFVTDAKGRTLAASNYDQPGSFIGYNYRFRPYFRDAIQSGFGSYYAVGVTTGEPGYFLAVPIRLDGRDVGAAIVKIDLLPLEQQWRDAGELVAVEDKEGVIFLSSEPQWRYRSKQPLAPEGLARIRDEQRYGPADLAVLALGRSTIGWSGLPVASFAEGDAGPHRLMVDMPFAESGWTLLYFADLSFVLAQANIATIAAGLAGLLVLAALKIAHQKRQARKIELRARNELERRVAERTKELRQSNLKLETEIVERQRAQEQLDLTRDSLTQAERLAAIGQAFAGLAHEINQPLAALRTYLASTRMLLARQDTNAVHSNIDVMGEVIGRVSHLTDQLKRLARRDDADFAEIDFASSIDRIAELLKFRFADLGISFSSEIDRPLLILGNNAQLDQVMLNLLGNAIDAVRDRSVRVIRIDGSIEGGACVVRVHDSGPGLDEKTGGRLFEPFHTTKAAGEGLGLGLATVHRILSNHHGEITAGRSPLGGALFTIRLSSVDGAAAAAE